MGHGPSLQHIKDYLPGKNKKDLAKHRKSRPNKTVNKINFRLLVPRLKSWDKQTMKNLQQNYNFSFTKLVILVYKWILVLPP
jgi:hypothetical protein